MKKRTGLALAGGILEIIAGTYLLIYSLWALYIYTQIPNGLSMYNWEFLIIFVCLILFGIFAIIGKTKKDLAGYGIFNLLFIGFLIYRAITATSTLSYAVAVILIFAVEIILLLIATMFFFFNKKSEYEIFFYEKLKIFKEKEPQENKKVKKIFLIVSLITLILLALTPLLKLIGLVLSACIIIGFIVFTNIFSKRNTTNYNLKTNIVYSTISLCIMFICVMFVAVCYSFNASGIKNVVRPATGQQISNKYLYYDNADGEYLILQGQSETIYVDNVPSEIMIYYADNGRTFNTIPSTAIEITVEWTYYDPTIEESKIAYEYYNALTNKKEYYLQSEQSIVDKLPQYKTVSNNQSTNTPLMIVVECIGLLISTTLILASNKAQMELEVKKQIKQEENKKILNRQ